MQRLRSYVSANQLKTTRQREAIADVFFGTQDHLSAEELHVQVRNFDSSISLATVYRTLKLLVDADLADARNFGGDGQTRYEPADHQEDHHDHLICLDCGKILEFVDDRIEELQDEVAESYGFVIKRHKMEIYGECLALSSQGSCENRLKT